MPSDIERLVIPTSLGQITVATTTYGLGHEYVACLEVEDDSTGNTETGFGSNATAYLTRQQVRELHDFLAKFL